MTKKVGFIVSHPSDVYLFRYIIRNLEKKGLETVIFLKERENIVGHLLDALRLDYIPIAESRYNMISRVMYLPVIDIKLKRELKRNKINLTVGRMSPYMAHASFLNGIKFIAFEDSEPTKINIMITLPFTDCVITPMGFKKQLDTKKHIRIAAYKEIAYLHQRYFKPNDDIYQILGIPRKEKYVLMRFGAFDSYHDIGQRGLSLKNKITITDMLKNKCHIFISSERSLPKELKEYELKAPVERMHDIIYHAEFIITDTQTSTTEAACLGTPAIRSNTFVGPNDMSNFIELEQKYGLIFNYKEPKEVIEKALELIQQPSLKREWARKREKMLKDKIDVTAFMTWFIENYPESFKVMKENPDYQRRFK